MKRFQLTALVNSGIASTTAHTLDTKDAYKLIKLRLAILDEQSKTDKAKSNLVKEAGIDDPKSFDTRLAELRKVKNPTDEQKKELDGLTVKLARFQELLEELLNEDVSLDVKPISFESWRQLRKENADKGENHTDLIPNFAEDLLKGVFWTEPVFND